jgi:hypothetical protein
MVWISEERRHWSARAGLPEPLSQPVLLQKVSFVNRFRYQSGAVSAAKAVLEHCVEG